MWRILNSVRKPGEEREGKRKADEETEKEEEKMKKIIQRKVEVRSRTAII